MFKNKSDYQIMELLIFDLMLHVSLSFCIYLAIKGFLYKGISGKSFFY